MRQTKLCKSGEKAKNLGPRMFLAVCAPPSSFEDTNLQEMGKNPESSWDGSRSFQVLNTLLRLFVLH